MIYYVEDDKNIRDLVVDTLKQTGLAARGFAYAEEFDRACEEQMPTLVLLDIMLPHEDGLSILKRLKTDLRTCGLPVIMVTAKGTEYDTVIGLDTGADDYITKPFGMMELVARVKALLRRTTSQNASDKLIAGELTLDVKKRSVTVEGEKIVLTFREFELLRYLMENQGIAFDRERLLQTVWGYDYDGGSRTVDVHIQTLRQKLDHCGTLIETVRGVGYRFGG
ncbi:MAG TPA: response regulator transcription factor [Clostridiales bacterium]|nr:response regulator transcription factor [Clostridiales bacterium]